MTLHRPTNLMGTASSHEAGERLANPIAPGAKPLTAEERAARRKRHEDAQKLARMRASPAEFVKEAMGVALQPWQQEVMRALHSPNYAQLSDLTKEMVRQQRELAHSMDMSRYIVGIDTAKPGADSIVAVAVRNDGGRYVVDPVKTRDYFWRDDIAQKICDAAKRIEEKGA